MPKQRAIQEAKGSASGLEAEAVEVGEVPAVMEVSEVAAVDVVGELAAVEAVREVPAVMEVGQVVAIDEVGERPADEEVGRASAEETLVTDAEPEQPRKILPLPAPESKDDFFLLLEAVPRGRSYLPPGIFFSHYPRP